MMEQPMMAEQQVPQDKALVYTTRFGEVTLRDDRLINFQSGILGFNTCTVFGLSRLPNVDESPILLLQCVNDPDVCFMVADPTVLGLDLKQEDKEKAIKEVAMSETETQFLVILTMYEQGDSYYLTANMRAPLMIDSKMRSGRQHILSNKEYTTQHKL